MASNLQQVRLPAPVNGQSSAYAPDRVPSGYARRLLNMLTHIPGKVIARGSVGVGSFSTFSAVNIANTNTTPCGIWVNTRKERALVGYRSTGALLLQSGDMFPRQSELNPAYDPTGATPYTNLFVAASAYKIVDMLGSSLTTTSTLADISDAPGWRYCQVGANVFGAGYSPRQHGTAGFAAGSIRGYNYLVVWDGTNAPTAVTADSAPRGVVDCMNHYERLFVLCSAFSDATGGLQHPQQVDPLALGYRFAAASVLMFSNPFSSTATSGINSGPVAQIDWRDPVTTNQVNYIAVGSAGDNDPGMGLARVNGNLVILKRNSIWQLYGKSTADFQIRQVYSKLGCVDTRSIVSTDDGVYFMSDRGLMVFDGTSCRNVSTQIWQTIQDDIFRNCVQPQGVGLGYCQVSRISERYLMMTIGREGSGTADTGATISFFYNLDSGAWSEFQSFATSTGLETTGYWKWAVQGLLTTFIANAERMVYAGRVTSPRGSNRKDTNGSTNVPIVTMWRTPLINLVDPGAVAQLQRVIAEVFNTGSDNVTLTMYDSTLAQIATWNIAGASVLNIRAIRDAFHETKTTGSIYFELTFPDTNSQGNPLEFYGLDVEFKEAEPRRLG